MAKKKKAAMSKKKIVRYRDGVSRHRGTFSDVLRPVSQDKSVFHVASEVIAEHKGLLRRLATR